MENAIMVCVYIFTFTVILCAIIARVILIYFAYLILKDLFYLYKNYKNNKKTIKSFKK